MNKLCNRTFYGYLTKYDNFIVTKEKEPYWIYELSFVCLLDGINPSFNQSKKITLQITPMMLNNDSFLVTDHHVFFFI